MSSDNDNERALERIAQELEATLKRLTQELEAVRQAQRDRRQQVEASPTPTTAAQPPHVPLGRYVGKCSECDNGQVLIAGFYEDCDRCDGRGNLRG